MNNITREVTVVEALREALQFQSAPEGPTIHDFGRWRRALTNHTVTPAPALPLTAPVTDDEIDAAFGELSLLRESTTVEEMRRALEGFAAGRAAGVDPVVSPDAEPAWQLIETAPKHTEVMVWREDSGPFIAKWTTPDGVMSTEEIERNRMEFPDDFEEWWSDAYGWQEGSEKPTHWMPLPPPPADAKGGKP